MKPTHPVSTRYLDGSYAAKNPDWDSGDAEWKASLVCDMLDGASLSPARMVEVGCGSGAVLSRVRDRFPGVVLTGFDISPDAARFWPAHEGKDIDFVLEDFLEGDHSGFDVLMLLDVIEHVPDPAGFLSALHGRAKYFLFHFPLDLSVINVLREWPLLRSRDEVGHIHYFSRGLALALLAECGFSILAAEYTRAGLSGPRKGWRTRIARLPRMLAYAADKDWGVRLLGGETLMVLATSGKR